MPGYEVAMARNGLYGNDEDDFLQYCDAAIGNSAASSHWAHDPCAEAHLLAGIDPAGLQELDKEYPLQDMAWYRDARFSNLVQATKILSSNETGVDPDDGPAEWGFGSGGKDSQKALAAALCPDERNCGDTADQRVRHRFHDRGGVEELAVQDVRRRCHLV